MQRFSNQTFFIDDDPDLLQIDVIHHFLSHDSYWAQQRTLEQVIRSIQHSYCLGAYLPSGDQVGFARMVTDWTTFVWICDVFVLEVARGIGIGKQLVNCIVTHPQLQDLRRMMLITRDAHGLYKQYGFVVEDNPDMVMKRIKIQT